MTDPGIYLVNASGEATPLATGGGDDIADAKLLSDALDTHDAHELLLHERADTIAATILVLLERDEIGTDLPVEALLEVHGPEVGGLADEKLKAVDEAVRGFSTATLDGGDDGEE
jgi:hypothetical protein